MIKKILLYILIFIAAFIVSLSADALIRENRSPSSKIAERLIAMGNTAVLDYGIESQEAYFDEKLQDNQTPYEKPSFFYDTEITSSEENAMKVYRFKPDTSDSNMVILYLHGGGYINRPTFFHFRFVDKLSDDLNAEAFMPLYPLAPEYTAKDTYDAVLAYYQGLIETHRDKEIVIVGDSAGAGLALGLSQTLKEEGIAQPRELVLMAPWLDIRLDNPKIDPIEDKDPMLDRKAAQFIGEEWAGDLPLTNHQVSPLYGTIVGLPPITLIQGTYDILYPDSQKLYERAVDEGVEIDYHVYDKMAHVFPLYMFVKESKEAYDLIVNTLNE